MLWGDYPHETIKRNGKIDRHNIVAQAGQSMLAEANQATQGVLSLLQ